MPVDSLAVSQSIIIYFVYGANHEEDTTSNRTYHWGQHGKLLVLHIGIEVMSIGAVLWHTTVRLGTAYSAMMPLPLTNMVVFFMDAASSDGIKQQIPVASVSVITPFGVEANSVAISLYVSTSPS